MNNIYNSNNIIIEKKKKLKINFESYYVNNTLINNVQHDNN